MTRRRPAQLTPEAASAFDVASVVARYELRPPYPDALHAHLLDLIAGARRVLDLGCGTGRLARALAPHVDRVDAVDISPSMIDAARAAPGGDAPRIRWAVSPAETFAYDDGYGLIVAGQSLHWMDWDRVLPRLAAAAAPGARLALVGEDLVGQPWWDALLPVIVEYSLHQDHEPYDLVEELTARDLFREEGRRTFVQEGYSQSVDDYIESFHARGAFPREWMGAARAQAFDDAARAVVAPHAQDGRLRFDLQCPVTWGRPLDPSTR